MHLKRKPNTLLHISLLSVPKFWAAYIIEVIIYCLVVARIDQRVDMTAHSH